MAVEGYANSYATTLGDVGGITSGATTLTLTSATGAPTAPFRVLIESELILVGARTGTACSSLTRGIEGTTAAAHAQSVGITHVLTAAGLLNSPGALTTKGDLGTLDASGNALRLAVGTDGQVLTADSTQASGFKWGIGESTYQQAVLNLSPFAYWRLGERRGSSLVDSSGGGLTGTYVNFPALAYIGALRNDPDTAAVFTAASSQYASLSANQILGGSVNSSVVLWVNFVTMPTDAALYCERASTNDIYRFSATTPNGLPSFAYRDDAGTLNIVSASTGSYTGGWHMFALVKAGTGITFYADGSSVATGTLTATDNFTNPSVTTLLAADGSGPNLFLDGRLDEVAIWKTNLSAANITTLWNAGT